MDYMERALSLARQALGHVSPNPAVGAVVVRDGVIVGEGFTQPPGSDHSEIVVLKHAGAKVRGATLYVTLEPCCHFGRTPPCSRALIAAGIAEVHLAMLDPNPLVSGRGRMELEQAGIKTVTGEHEAEARGINEAYIKYITTGFPFVIAKFAMSLDGKIATASGDSRWISGGAAQSYVHELRRNVDAIIVGVNTVLADDPQLTARSDSGEASGRQPLRIIADAQGRTPASARVFSVPTHTLLAVAEDLDRTRARTLEQAGAELIRLPSREGLVDLKALFKLLGQKQVTSVLAEGGGQLLGSLFDQGLVDKVVVFIAPIVIGGTNAKVAVAGQGVDKVSQALRLRQVRIEMLDQDIMVIGYTGA